MTMHRNFVNRIIDICKENKDKTFITYMKTDDTEENWTYGEYLEMAQSIAYKFQRSSIGKGERILVMAPLSPYVYIMITALAMCGSVSVIINPALPEEELDSIIKKSDIRGIVCDEQTYQKYAFKWNRKYPVFDVTSGNLYIEREYQLEPSEDIHNDVLAILYSSGTTSEPKGVMITYEAQMKSAELLLRAFGTNDIRYLLIFPMFHVSGFSTFFALFFGGAQIGLLENATSIKLMEGFPTKSATNRLLGLL